MAQPAETLDRYDLATDGDDVREQFANRIYDISPRQTPFITMAGRGGNSNTYFTWLQDRLRDPDPNNAWTDGDDFQGRPIGATKRMGNYNQIMREEATVSGRVEAVNKAARRSELARQVMRKGLEIRRDMETIYTGNQAGLEGDGTGANPARTATLCAWYRTNEQRGAGGAAGALSNGTNGFPNTAATDGTTRALSETMMLDAMQQAWRNGGEPTYVLVEGEVKRRFSNYMYTADARIATQYQDQGKNLSAASVIGAVDYWLTDFGTLHVVADRFSRPRDVHILDFEYWSVDYLRQFQVHRMGKSGDNEKRMLLVDSGLCAKNEEASAIVADIDETQAMVA